MVEVFTREMFNGFLNLCSFSLFVISIIYKSSNIGWWDFVCCRVISEMQHALEARLSFYKWRYEHLLNLRDLMAMMKAMPLKVECSNNISPLLHPYFYNINTFNTPFKSQFNFTHNFDDLQLFWMYSSIPCLKYVNLGGQYCPKSPEFFSPLWQQKKCLGYITAFVGLISVSDLVGKLIPIKWRVCDQCLHSR